MTQPQNPGQPYIPPSAGSAAGSYNPQQYPQQAPQPQQYQPAQPVAQSAPAAGQFQDPYAPGLQYSQPAADSFFTNLFDGARSFAAKYGKTVFIVGFVLYVVAWIFGAFDAAYYYSSYDGTSYFTFTQFLVNLFLDIPKVAVNILILRLFIEIAAKIGAPKTEA
ncbi:hypothetical protein [Actinomyces sp. MRS3W]|uniref:hypothetical protein n=1 Tax=Actinomyces sp. MRS3W TaxID=2800796 RepID=UPI0028FD4B0E|nr:hypothetical protein [Actinomyces sp. MRS3W]MDU0348778.1 hypothetical protein [Actinomyces sp. MRS3W]